MRLRAQAFTNPACSQRHRNGVRRGHSATMPGAGHGPESAGTIELNGRIFPPGRPALAPGLLVFTVTLSRFP